ncbi:hypothetical protein Pla123a_45050 [Posidoniimonas polymericola]|uniref:Uncharacterized protein n=1 Tax=Posidoniimonas polymericola TaxID=2528002 RepID=A0A5C5XUA2_9BACT|nr:hypothetical protein [Posidoniimonas polymericola]TWT66807.1 hypothetical protein Pla123a_45050 [Posidoniimonas polymericola]
MSRGRESDEIEVSGQDSFLDVVANIVGILILLVMVVGLRVSRETHDPTEAPVAQTPAVSRDDLVQAHRDARDAYRQAATAIEQLERGRRELRQLDDERLAVAAFVAEAEASLDEKRAALGVDKRRDLELRTKLLTAQTKLEKLAREQVTLAAYTPQVETIESLPTPLAKTVSGDEIEIRLEGGRAAVIPMNALAEEAMSHMEENVWRLQSRDKINVWAGPIDGFRLVCHLRKASFITPSGQQAAMPRLVAATVMPEPGMQGEPIIAETLENTRLIQFVKTQPKTTTVTIWTYDDSFEEYGVLKRKLYELGYPTAGRPLPEGAPIMSAASGTRASAQ